MRQTKDRKKTKKLKSVFIWILPVGVLLLDKTIRQKCTFYSEKVKKKTLQIFLIDKLQSTRSFFKDCYDSLINKTLQEFEVVVLDENCSKMGWFVPETNKIIKKMINI